MAILFIDSQTCNPIPIKMVLKLENFCFSCHCAYGANNEVEARRREEQIRAQVRREQERREQERREEAMKKEEEKRKKEEQERRDRDRDSQN